MAIHKLSGKVQHYDWGGRDFIAELLGREPDGTPCAEYWMGTHPNGVSHLDDEVLSLAEYIENDPETILGKQVASDFDQKLPFLFKVLDVASMLSIQVHPTKEEARKGFDAEESAGVPLYASNRNFKDSNHKPEIMVALSEFWLLHGFRSPKEIMELLHTVREFSQLLPQYVSQNTKLLFQFLMELPQTEVDRILRPLQQRLEKDHPAKNHPDYWAKKAFEIYTKDGHFDRGVFSIYLLNLVKIDLGDAIFQGAGIPHAYLQGQNMELMANSDNVFRGGLTPKYIDVEMLMKHTSFEVVEPKILKGLAQGCENVFKTSCKDFELAKITLEAGGTYSQTTFGPNIYFVYEGQGTMQGNAATLNYTQGTTFFIDRQEVIQIHGITETTVFVARMPRD